ncbi:MAG: hypothetical protein OXG35_27235, partial [Acidobacteria bacterium]|nr:hypothetical protein [Acidobacteriota bacterium]
TAPTALILAAQTNQQLEHGPLQTAVDQLVWSDNIEEIERTAACLAVKPHSLVKPADANCDNDEPDPVDFGRMNGNQIVSCYHHARLMLTKSQETGAAPPGEAPSGPDVPPAPGRGTPPAAA